MTEAIVETAPEREQRVTALELFFDLVFVFAITQVTAFVYHEPGWTRLVEALAILMALWFAWTGYVWLGNTAGTDEGAIRVVMLVVMGPLLVCSLAVPHAFGEDALVFGLAYFAVRVLHIVAYRVVARGDPVLAGAVLRLAWTILPAAFLLVLAGLVPAGPARAACWIAALAVDYGGLVLTGVRDWHVEPGHFAERHGLIIIIALGESIVALGVGGTSLTVRTSVVCASLFGMAVAGALWWAYFDVVATVAERRLRAATAHDRARLARDSYSYLHLPMVTGIVIFAFGVKSSLGHLDESLDALPAVALSCGVALYFLALSAFKRRNVGSWNYPRLVVAALLVAVAPVFTAIPALASIACVAAVSCALIAYECYRYAEARDRIRHSS